MRAWIVVVGAIGCGGSAEPPPDGGGDPQRRCEGVAPDLFEVAEADAPLQVFVGRGGPWVEIEVGVQAASDEVSISGTMQDTLGELLCAPPPLSYQALVDFDEDTCSGRGYLRLLLEPMDRVGDDLLAWQCALAERQVEIDLSVSPLPGGPIADAQLTRVLALDEYYTEACAGI